MMTKVEMKYLHCFTDRHGRKRCYFRYRGRKWPLPLPSEPNFGAAYDARLQAIKEHPTPIILGNVRFLKGTIGWTVDQFLDSKEYGKRAANTKKYTKRLLLHIRDKYGAGQLRHLTPKNTKQIRNAVAEEFTDSIADVALSLISVLWEYADKRLYTDLGANPTVGISRLHHTEKEHEPWPPHVIKAFDIAVKPRIKLARLLALYTGQRRSDLVEMDWARFNGETIEVRQIKTDELLEIPCHKVLRAALEGIPITERKDTILKTRNGRKYTAQGLAEAFRRTLKKIGAKGCSIHGLRKNAAKALADAGCSDREIMAITGHKTAAMVTKYTKRADQLRRARRAVAKWEIDDDLANRERKGDEEWLPSLKSNEK